MVLLRLGIKDTTEIETRGTVEIDQTNTQKIRIKRAKGP